MENCLLNTWYMFGWGHELGSGMLARTILDLPIVVFRGADGVTAALHDRCPHRFAPLSRGKLSQGVIECGYHGLCFDSTGQCVKNPYSDRIPPSAQVRSFPIVEQDNILWIWPGDPGKANPSQIVRFPDHIEPGYHFVYGHSMVRADYELITDNLLDLTHTTYLHPSFGGGDYIPETFFEQVGDTVCSRYFIRSFPTPAYNKSLFPKLGDGPIDEWDTMRWDVPATLHLALESVATGRPRSEAWRNSTDHILTPSSAHTTWYFWASGVPRLDYVIDDASHIQLLTHAFEMEDTPMLEAVQHRLGEITDILALRPTILPGDTAAVYARRILRARLKSEDSAAAASGIPSKRDVDHR